MPCEKIENNRISKHRWSTRMITNVADEIGNVIQKVQHGDQLKLSLK